ncbi:cytochrome P450 [Labrenzia sp. EL_126]|nr:cytochrome P450 [Labrenzia sp. EL_126]
MKPPPVLSDVTIEELAKDPYPTFDRIRSMASAVWVDSARIHLVTRFDDIMTVERNHHLFASTNPGSLMNKVMGHSLMRKDDEPHKLERAAVEPSFRPGVVKQHWAPRFRSIANDLINQFEADGETDLFSSFAAPMASLSLIDLLGFEDVAWEDIAWWSQALMDGVGNYQADPEISNRARRASAAIDQAIDHVLARHVETENPSILSSMAHAGHNHSREQIRANIKVIVGGGLNEPRDAILTTVLGLLQNPEQLAQAQANEKLFARAFEESVRWISPIGMYPRRVTQDTVLGNTRLKAEDQLGICVGAANRDTEHFDQPDSFDLNRTASRHLGFGAGPHFCAGTWVARQMVGEIAVPMLFNRLTNLRLQAGNSPILRGWVFRGPTALPVRWDR